MSASAAGTRRLRSVQTSGGFQLIELLVVLAVLGMVATVGIPPVVQWSRQLKVDLAAHELVGVLRLARSYAIRHSTRAGVKFRVADGSRVTYTLYLDGDGDGVLSADIDSGDDPPVGRARELAHFGGQAGFGFPPGPAPRDPGNPQRRLGRLEDPIRFNRSDIASFDHLGGSTPGSLYLTDGRHLLSVVRVHGRTGKVRIMRYLPESEEWQ